MRHEFVVHNKGLKSQYYVLKVYRNDKELPIVHTSKDLKYLNKLFKERYQSETHS